MRTKDLPPHIQDLLKKIKQAKKDHAAVKALEDSRPINYEMATTYQVAGTEQSLTIELAAESDLTAWKESDSFLRDFYADESIEFKQATIYQKHKEKYTTTDIGGRTELTAQITTKSRSC